MAISFNKYYYDIDVHLINNDTNEIIDINNNFIQLKNTYNYKKNVFPITQIMLSLDLDLYSTIRNNDVMLRMSIKKKVLDSLTDEENVLSGEFYIYNELFSIIDKNKLEYIPEDENTDIPSLTVNLTLFSMNHLKINKHVFNGNYLDCRLTEIVALMNGINQAKLYIEKPNNQSRLEQVIIPPLNSVGMLNYLQKYYHLYQDDLRLFFDFDSYYIMNSNLSDRTPVERGDYKNVIFDILSDPQDKKVIPFDCGYKAEYNDYYYIKTDNENISIIDNTNIKEEIFGTNNIILSKDDNLNVTREDYTYDERLIDKTKVYLNKLNNPNAENALNKIHKRKVAFKFSNLDIETFKCNKLFKCTMNNESYNLKVENLIFVFTKDKNTGNCNSQGLCYFEEN